MMRMIRMNRKIFIILILLLFFMIIFIFPDFNVKGGSYYLEDVLVDMIKNYAERNP